MESIIPCSLIGFYFLARLIELLVGGAVDFQ